MNKIHIISAGAVTGLGFDLPASTVAMQGKLDNFKETDFLDNDNENYVGSAIPTHLLSADYPQYGIAKLRLLLKKAVLESLSRLGYSADQQQPFCYSNWSVIFVLSPEHANQAKQLQTLLKSIPILANASFLDVAIGSSGVGIALNTAEQLLNDKEVDSVLIASMDTWLEPSLINQGKRQNRLLDSENGIGCIPAEATTALVLSHSPYETHCPVAVLGVGVGREPILLMDSDKMTMGRGLRDAYRYALSMANIEMTDLHLRIGDVTGEEYSFQESITGYGSVLEGTMPKGYEALLTSSYLGDVRSSSGLFSMAYIWQLAQNEQFNDKFAVSHMSSPSHEERTVVIMQTAEINPALSQPLPISDTLLTDVVQQHIEEASLYWLRCQDALWHPVMAYSDFNRFDTLMKAHLYGLLVAGQLGFTMALEQLEQWQTIDEMFVSMYVALNAKEQQQENLQQIQAYLDEDDSLYQGAKAAIMATDDIACLIDKWWNNGNIQQKNAIFPALMKDITTLNHKYLSEAIQSDFIPLQQQAIRTIGELSLAEYKNELNFAVNSSEFSCKLEAVCSLALLKDASPFNKITASELLDNQVSQRGFMAWSYNVSTESFESWIKQAKDSHQTWELLWSLFFRSETKYLPDIIEVLENDKENIFSRLSSYVIKHLTGIDIDEIDILVNEEADFDEKDEDSADEPTDNNEFNKNYWRHQQQYELIQSGLSYPNVQQLIKKLQETDLNTDEKVVNGQPISNIKEDLLNQSLPQIQLINLYQKSLGKKFGIKNIH